MCGNVYIPYIFPYARAGFFSLNHEYVFHSLTVISSLTNRHRITDVSFVIRLNIISSFLLKGPVLPGAHAIERYLIEEYLHTVVYSNYKERKDW